MKIKGIYNWKNKLSIITSSMALLLFLLYLCQEYSSEWYPYRDTVFLSGILPFTAILILAILCNVFPKKIKYILFSYQLLFCGYLAIFFIHKDLDSLHELWVLFNALYIKGQIIQNIYIFLIILSLIELPVILFNVHRIWYDLYCYIFVGMYFSLVLYYPHCDYYYVNKMFMLFAHMLLFFSLLTINHLRGTDDKHLVK